MRILLLGPTAVGKTGLSIKLAGALNAEIISADSRQCYRHLDIGTAKPGARELEQVRHYNISILDPDEPDSAADFYERAMQWEEKIRAKGKKILYVGGSTLHLQAIIKPFDDVPESDPDNVAQLERTAEREGIDTLYSRLEEVDPDYAKKMDGMNTQRIIRALDVWMQTGRPFSSFHSEEESFELPPETRVFGLQRDRKKLYERINRRVDRMFEQGFLDEVGRLLELGYGREDHALDSVGYRDAIEYLNGEKTLEQAVKDMKTQTRRYAKRQLTWFRRWDFIHWVDMDRNSETEALKIILDTLAAKSQNR